ILTGAGSDGSLGLRRIKECGGLTIAQDPDEAEFDSMPRSAIATHMVDLVLPLREISNQILQFCDTRPRLPVPDDNDGIGEQDDVQLWRLVDELRRRTGHDLRVYRRSSLLRRLRRRMQLQHVTSLDAYFDLLARQPEEAQAMTEELQLQPTEFFR